ncbi:MAG TPA: hypothetical protein P5185_01555, partial [Oscillospiraceae bacterium]|nr:hypothetical protein [Oscillospiraceae bacterium]
RHNPIRSTDKSAAVLHFQAEKARPEFWLRQNHAKRRHKRNREPNHVLRVLHFRAKKHGRIPSSTEDEKRRHNPKRNVK